MRHTEITHPEGLAGLGAGGNLKFVRAIHGLYPGRDPERRPGYIDIQFHKYVVAVTFKYFVTFHVYM